MSTRVAWGVWKRVGSAVVPRLPAEVVPETVHFAHETLIVGTAPIPLPRSARRFWSGFGPLPYRDRRYLALDYLIASTVGTPLPRIVR
jgi:hypothetical protein